MKAAAPLIVALLLHGGAAAQDFPNPFIADEPEMLRLYSVLDFDYGYLSDVNRTGELATFAWGVNSDDRLLRVVGHRSDSWHTDSDWQHKTMLAKVPDPITGVEKAIVLPGIISPGLAVFGTVSTGAGYSAVLWRFPDLPSRTFEEDLPVRQDHVVEPIDGRSVIARDITLLNDKSYAVLMQVQNDAEVDTDLPSVAVFQDGALVWRRTYSWDENATPATGRTLQAGPDFIVMVGQTLGRGWLLKIEASTGLVQNQLQIGGAEGEINDIVSTSEGWLLTGWSKASPESDKNMLIIGMSPDLGTILWERVCGGFGEDIGTAGATLPNGGFLIGGSSTSKYSSDPTGSVPSGSLVPLAWLLRLASDHSVMWETSTLDQLFPGGGAVGGAISGILVYQSQNEKLGVDIAVTPGHAYYGEFVEPFLTVEPDWEGDMSWTNPKPQIPPSSSDSSQFSEVENAYDVRSEPALSCLNPDENVASSTPVFVGEQLVAPLPMSALDDRRVQAASSELPFPGFQ